MNFITQMTSRRILRNSALIGGLLVCLALTSCSETDPLEAIRAQQASGDLKGTIEPLRELLKTRPDDPEINFLYGLALALTKGPNLATWSLRKAMKDPDWLVPAGLQLAYASLVASDFNEVDEITGKILEHEPDNVQALLMRANAHAHWKKDPKLALTYADQVLELDPDAIEAYEPRILALLSLDRLEEASESLAEAGRRLLELETSKGVLAWHCSTTAAFEQASGLLEQARETWIACLEAHPTNLEVVSSAIQFYDEQGERERTQEILRNALAEAPDSAIFRNVLAQRIAASGEADEAEALMLEPTRSEDPDLASQAWVDLANLRRNLGRYESAADGMEQAVELARATGSPSPQLLFELADFLVLADRFDRALEASKDLSLPAHRHLIRGRVAQERRHPTLALQEFDEALLLWPDNPWARYYAGLAAEELGNFNRAIAEYRMCVRIEPSATDARTRGAKLLYAKGEAFAAQVLLLTEAGEAPLEIAGLLLSVRLAGFLADTNAITHQLSEIDQLHPAWAGQALKEAAEGLAERAGNEQGSALAASMLESAPGADFKNPRFVAALRALVRFSHEAGETASMRETLESALAANPNSSAYEEVRAFDLELSLAPAETVRAAYERALALGPKNAKALAGLGRLALLEDPEVALGFFDRAAAENPFDPDLKLQAARALIALERLDRAAARLDALLLAHPFSAEAATERVQLDLTRDVATEATLERARRAVLFSTGADALELLSQVHTQRGDPELAERAAKGARARREAQAAEVQAGGEDLGEETLSQ